MGFTAVKCPSCGASVDLDDGREFGFCSYCGTKIVQDKIIVEHRGSVTVEGTATKETLLERAKIMLRDGDFADADAYFDRVLDIDPHCAAAYWGKLCCKLHTPTDDALRSYPQSILDDPLYQKAVEFSDGAEKERYEKIGTSILERLQNAIAEQNALYRKSHKRVLLVYLICTVFWFCVYFFMSSKNVISFFNGTNINLPPIMEFILIAISGTAAWDGIVSLFLIKDLKRIHRYKKGKEL